ncbi:ADP-ribose pyrophosphatase [Clostridium saccharoperbutylacetonicum]|uniref:ADP-ribose pyrophosphatase NudF n=1 Tax=Clostridium saccharoperbutylacetonicum N1-4(HMT) TaxID=931276 RepID=M1N0F7_9CLOT|nr:NUDIX hydrolase [Clostridium saccharoperbutylacetonicum]AGF57057.1 ADP-ribose pyrophosphatase NudF [Clostridium saccharoperbutylacetonicum N1-4(HMT)]NRT62184.1 ADP-ribose pyrophosphatase [Clostridium saccharoperbutylacetonicum]NSB25515.1 ADP-ribose pyrophosphatase [Clostridium saccharoperbutylacetonicum]NSB44885.1 ADP-ribose pyrophosphatase [Clostridium saccharoperbutylacetonicum]
MKQNKIAKVKPLIETRYLKLYEAEYENKVGDIRTWTIASRKDNETIQQKFFENKKDSPDGVIIAAYHKELKKIVIIKQFRIPLNSFVYELPAGLIDPGEDAKSTIGRELMEETGLKIVDIIKNRSIEQVYVSAGMTDESLAFTYCTCEGEVSDAYLEDDECIETLLVSQEEAVELITSKDKFDIKCYLLLQSFALLGEELFSEA